MCFGGIGLSDSLESPELLVGESRGLVLLPFISSSNNGGGTP